MTYKATTRIGRALIPLFAGLALMLSSDVLAQTIIEPGPPGTINLAILGDTTDTGERNSCHYVLRRDAVYIYNQRITMRADCAWIIEAEEGDGARPIIRPAALPGGEESPRQFHLFANTTLHLRNLYLDGYNTALPDPGVPSDNAMVRVGVDSASVFIDGVRFDRNRQSSLRSDNAHVSFFVTNSQFSNLYNDTRPDQSFVIDTRGNQLDSLVFINNSIWNHADAITRNANVAKINYYKFDHNTFVNVAGALGGSDGRLDTLRAEEPGEQDAGIISFAQSDFAVFRNNLMVNVGLLGTETQDVFVPRFIVDIDSALVEIDSVTFGMEAPQGVDIRNNVFSFDASIASAYPDTIRLYTADEVYDPTLDLFIDGQGSAATLLTMDVPLNSAPGADPDFVTDYWDFATGARERQPLFFPRDTRTPEGEGDLDFAYSMSSAAFTAGTDGLPVGDLNWFGMAEGYVSGPDEFAMPTANEGKAEIPDAFRLHGNYPNPFNPSTNIQFDLHVAAEVSVDVFDLLGRKVMTLSVQQMNAGAAQSIPVDASALASGMYLYRVTARTVNNTMVKAGTMLLVK